jgi:hypothetical protein
MGCFVGHVYYFSQDHWKTQEFRSGGKGFLETPELLFVDLLPLLLL